MNRLAALACALLIHPSVAFAAEASADRPATAPSLAQQKLEVARQGCREAEKSYLAGLATFQELVAWGQRLVESEREAAPDAAACAAALRQHLDLVRRWEKAVEQRARAGLVGPLDIQAAKYHRIQVELLLEAEMKAGAATRPAAP